MRPVSLSPVGFPPESVAGAYRARLLIKEQVVRSKELDPLDDVTVQLVTRPLGPMSRRKPTVPCSSLLMAAVG